MGVLSEYGMYLGVQWVWTIQLTLYHATMSTLIPIAIVDLAWPRYRDVPLLKKRGLVLASAGLVFITLIGMVFIGTMVEGAMVPFHPHPPAVDRRVPGGGCIDLAGPPVQGQQDRDLEANPEKAIVVRCGRVFVYVAEPDHTRDPG